VSPSIVSYLEAPLVSPIFSPVHIDAVDAGPGGPDIAVFDRLLDVVSVAFEEGLYAAVREVSHPSRQAELTCNVPGKGPVKNPLHPPPYYQMCRCQLHGVIIAERGF